MRAEAPRGETTVDRVELGPTPTLPQEPDKATISTVLGCLRGAGMKSVVNPQAVEKAFQTGAEALVRFESPVTTVASFKNQAELSTYARLNGGDDLMGDLEQFLQVPEETRTAFHQLTKLAGDGNAFYFPRQRDRLSGFLPLPDAKTWLRTDAAGAAILLARGEDVRVLQADGNETTLKDLQQATQLTLPAPTEERKKALELLDRLASLKPKVLAKPNLEQPADQLLTDYEAASHQEVSALLKSPFQEQVTFSAFLQHKKMVDDLASGGVVTIVPEGAYPFYSTMVDLKGLETVTQFLTRGNREMITYNQGFDKLVKSGGLAFARQEAGEGTGALIKASSLSGYLTLADGGELVVLDRKGDLTPCHSIDEFMAAVYRDPKNPDRQQFLDDARLLQKSGFSFLVPSVTNRGFERGDAFDVDKALVDKKLVKLEGPDGQVRTIGRQHVTRMAAERRPEAGQTGETADAPGLALIDRTKPKQNLFLVYYNALQNPNDKFGYYDDFPVKLMDEGSSNQMDIVIQRSDLPTKNNLRVDYVQPGLMEPLATLDSSRGMDEPQVFEDFVYNSLKAHPDREHVRLMAVGHGGAEGGTIDDWTRNGEINNMSVEDFAGSISKALDRLEAETGKRPVIDNLVMGSCLMGNTSLIDALARRGDVKYLSGSPEVLLDGFPKEVVAALNRPENATMSAEDYARALVDINMQATGLQGGRENRRHALIYGSYDLSAEKNDRFRDALGTFFKECNARPQFAAYYREAVQDAPGYNIHPAGGPGIGSKERDLIQVLRGIANDARIGSPAIKAAALELIEASQAQVLAQQVAPGYEGREGASLMLPLNNNEIDLSQDAPTQLLRDVPYKEFIRVLQSAPDRRLAHEIIKDTAFKQKGALLVDTVTKIEPFEKTQLAKEEQALIDDLATPAQKGFLRSAGAAVTGTIGAVVGGIAGAVTGAVAGTFVGLRAGYEGSSAYQTHRPKPLNAPPPQAPRPQPAATPGATFTPAQPAKEEKPKRLGSLGKAMDAHPELTRPALLAPAEFVGGTVHQSLAPRFGNFLARLVAVPVGVIGGFLGGIATGLVAGGVLGAEKGASLINPPEAAPA